MRWHEGSSGSTSQSETESTDSHAPARTGDDDGSSGSTSQSETESEGDSSDALEGTVNAFSSAIRRGGDWQQILRRSMRSSSCFFSWPVRVILPCAGWDAPCQALQILGVEHRVVGAWDTDAVCGDVWRAVHRLPPTKPLPPQFHTGLLRGDIKRVSLRELPDADLLVSGPPCPPFSAQGKRLHFSDSRAQEFNVVVKWIYHPRALAHRERARRAHCLLRVQPFRPPARLGASRPHVLRVFRLPEQIGSKFTSLVLPDRSCILHAWGRIPDQSDPRRARPGAARRGRAPGA